MFQKVQMLEYTEEETMEKSCKNCKFYVPNYVIREGLGLFPVGGHGTRILKNGHRNDKIVLCRHYEKINENEIIDKKKRKARVILQSIEEKLENVVTFLEH